MLVPWSVRHGPHRVDIDPGKLLPVSRLVHDGTAYTDEGGEFIGSVTFCWSSETPS